MNDLALFRKSPRGGPSDSIMERAAARSVESRTGYHHLGTMRL